MLEEPVYVFLTAYSTPHFRKHVEEGLGVKNIFEKPIHIEQLRIILEQNTWHYFKASQYNYLLNSYLHF